MDRELRRAVDVVNHLQEWIDNRDGLSRTHMAGLTYTETTLEIFAGDVGLWCDQSDGSEDMTFEYCRDAFLKHIADFRPFFTELS